MGKIVAYHPEIWVRKPDGKIAQIVVDMDDYYDDGEVLGKLSGANPLCRTMGELVESVRNGKLSQEVDGVLSCCIEEGELTRESEKIGEEEIVHGWNDLINRF
jgi:hypothetical protein